MYIYEKLIFICDKRRDNIRFDIDVENNTDLKGAMIDSKAKADRNKFSTGTLTFSDLHNEAEYEAPINDNYVIVIESTRYIGGLGMAGEATIMPVEKADELFKFGGKLIAGIGAGASVSIRRKSD